MTPDTWERIKEIVADALELEPSRRPAYLDSACANDAALRAEAQALLPRDQRTMAFLEPPAPQAVVADGDTMLRAGDLIGRYRIRKLLAKGGMGAVFEATQDHPQRTVAIKILRAGLPAADMRRRFEHEVEVLGRLQHPAIARIYEAGVHETATASIPYFAMELVAGRDVVSAARGATLPAIVELFARVCDGVWYAHQRGVIHRDLKPQNILVDADGQPRILDFGIARITDADRSTATLRTEIGQVLGTLSYMSPEQIRADPDEIDVRTDVYSLGVVLYEMVTGRLPIDVGSAALLEAARLLAEHEPVLTPSVARAFHGDLQTIVQTALEKDKGRRYQSVGELAADLRAMLAEQPIAARRPSTLYQIGKFARRHRGLVGGLLLAFLFLVGGAIATALGMLKAARAQAVTAAVNGFLDRMLSSVDPEDLGGDVTMRAVLDRSAAEVDDSFADRPLVRGSLHETIGRSYLSLGVYDRAEQHLGRAAEVFGREHGPAAERTLQVRGDLGQALLFLGRVDDAERLIVETAALARRHHRPRSEVALVIAAREAMLWHSRGDLRRAEETYRAAIDGMRETLGPTAFETLTNMNNWAAVLIDAGRDQEAGRVLEEVLAARQRELGEDHPRVLSAASNLATALGNQGKYGDAERILRDVARLGARAWGTTHPRTLHAKGNRANALMNIGRADEALALLRETTREWSDVLGPDHEETLAAKNSLSTALIRTAQPDEAERVLREIIERCERTNRAEHRVAWRAIHNLASVLAEQRRFAEAEPFARRILDVYEREHGVDHREALAARNNLAWLLRDQDRTDEALALFERNLVLAEQSQPGSPKNDILYRRSLGRCLLAARRFEAAERELLAVYRCAREELELDGEPLEAHVRVLVELYDAWGKTEQKERFAALLRDR